MIIVDFLASSGPFNTAKPWDSLTAEMLSNAKDSGITAVNLTVSTGVGVEDTN